MSLDGGPGLIAQFSKCDFWNLGDFLNRNMWWKKIVENFLIEQFSIKKRKIFFEIKHFPKKINENLKISKFQKKNRKLKISKFLFVIDFFIDFFRKVFGLEKLFFVFWSIFFDQHFFDDFFFDHIFRFKKSSRFQKSHLENCAMRPGPPSRPIVYFFPKFLHFPLESCWLSIILWCHRVYSTIWGFISM